jgi:hypothetical protein
MPVADLLYAIYYLVDYLTRRVAIAAVDASAKSVDPANRS